MKSLFSLLLSCFLIVNVFAADGFSANSAALKTAQYLYDTVTAPTVASVGGEWTIIGLAQSGAEIPGEYFNCYYENLEKYVKSKNGILHARKYTEYSRVILALTAMGKDPKNVAGYDLTIPLADYKKTVQQGINGAAWALIALDSADYDIPKNGDAAIQATREMYIRHILERQNTDGGWSLGNNTTSDVDITAMCLRALAKYRKKADVGISCSRGVGFLADAQNGNGDFSSWGERNSESLIQVIIALCTLGIPLDDPRFVKNGKTLEETLQCYMMENGAFFHLLTAGENLMATEQGLLCLNAMRTAEKDKIIRKLPVPLVSNPLNVMQVFRDTPRFFNAVFSLTNIR